jgi:two-component system cell cycle response regulator DivK
MSQRKRVLVVDDNDLNLKLMTYLLATENCEVLTAVDAAAARRALSTCKPDLMLLDLQLPDMDGLQLTRMLRDDPDTSGMRIVAVTAYAMKGDEERARAAGVDDYVTKPIAKDEFRKTVARLLNCADRAPA